MQNKNKTPKKNLGVFSIDREMKKYSKILIMLDEDCIKVDEREILVYNA